jgi:hypothetical protein
MLVVERGSGLRLIRQVDHAALSGDIALAWRAPRAIPGSFWPSFVEAVRHHDDGWETEDASPAVSNGRPLDFKQTPVARHVAVWRRSMDLAGTRDVYQEIIVGNHARWLYTRFPRGDSGEDRKTAESFLEETRRRVEDRTEALRARGGEARAASEPGSLEAARKLLSFLDALSLALLGGLPFFSRTEPLPHGDGEAVLSLKRIGPEDPRGAGAAGAAVAPWPFVPARVELRPRAFDPGAETFASPGDCARAMAATHPTTLALLLEPWSGEAPFPPVEKGDSGSLSRPARDPL